MSVRSELGGQQPEEIRLRDLTLEGVESKVELGFDLTKIMTEEDWRGIDSILTGAVERVKNCGVVEDKKVVWDNFAANLSRIKLLSVARFRELNAIDERLLDRIGRNLLDGFHGRKQLIVADGEFEIIGRLSLAVSYSELFPGHVSELELNNERWERIKGEIKSGESGFSVEGALVMFSQLRILFPEKNIPGELNLKHDYLDKGRKTVENRMRMENYYELEKDIVAYRITFPDEEVIGKNNLKFWQEKKEELEDALVSLRQQNYRQSEWSDFIYLAANLKILAAEEIKITDQGLELIMSEKESFKQETPPRPERKELS